MADVFVFVSFEWIVDSRFEGADASQALSCIFSCARNVSEIDVRVPAIRQEAAAIDVDVENENAATAIAKKADVEEVREGL